MAIALRSLLICALLASTAKVYGDLGLEGLSLEDLDFDYNGYGTLGANYLNDNSINDSNSLKHSLFDKGLQYDVDSRLGLQGNITHSSGLGFTGQLVTLSTEDYDPEVEWSYLHFNYYNNLTIRAGRLRRPLYRHSDYRRVGYIYEWARLPIETYSEDLRFASSIDGIDVIYRFHIGQWDFDSEIYYGETSGGKISIADSYDTRDDYGLVIEAENDWAFFRLGYHRSPGADIEPVAGTKLLLSNLQLAGFSNVADDLRTADMDINFYNIAIGMKFDAWFVNTEFADYKPSRSLAPDSTSWYINGGKRMGKFTPHFTYSERKRTLKNTFDAPIYAQIDQLTPLAGNPTIDATIAGLTQLALGVDGAVDSVRSKHASYMLGLRYDFDQPMALKFEYQQIHDQDRNLQNDLFSVTFDFIFGGAK